MYFFFTSLEILWNEWFEVSEHSLTLLDNSTVTSQLEGPGFGSTGQSSAFPCGVYTFSLCLSELWLSFFILTLLLKLLLVIVKYLFIWQNLLDRTQYCILYDGFSHLE